MAKITIKKQLYNKYYVVPCVYCFKLLTKLEATIEHIIPKHKGGTDKKHNTVICCGECNQLKGTEHQILNKIEECRKEINNSMLKEKELWRQYEKVIEQLKNLRDSNLDILNKDIKLELE